MGSNSELVAIALPLLVALLSILLVVQWAWIAVLAQDVAQLQRDLATYRGTVETLAYDARRARAEQGGA